METTNGRLPRYKQWKSLSPRVVLLLVHGLGAHSGRWEALAGFFLGKGISSYAIELRGLDPSSCAHGGSGGFARHYNDILALYKIAVKDNPGKKIFLAGESLGALISFLFCVEVPCLFDGLVCISPAFATRQRLALSDCIGVLAHLVYDPGKLFDLPFDSAMCTRDTECRNKLDQDPREYRSVTSGVIWNILFAQVRARRMTKKMLTPALFLIPGEDKIVDPAPAVAIFNGLAVKDKTLVEFPGMYHSLSIELGKEEVFAEILKWIEMRI